jgi:hypothetical protein
MFWVITIAVITAWVITVMDKFIDTFMDRFMDKPIDEFMDRFMDKFMKERMGGGDRNEIRAARLPHRRNRTTQGQSLQQARSGVESHQKITPSPRGMADRPRDSVIGWGCGEKPKMVSTLRGTNGSLRARMSRLETSADRAPGGANDTLRRNEIKIGGGKN